MTKDQIKIKELLHLETFKVGLRYLENQEVNTLNTFQVILYNEIKNLEVLNRIEDLGITFIKKASYGLNSKDHEFVLIPTNRDDENRICFDIWVDCHNGTTPSPNDLAKFIRFLKTIK